VAEHQYVKQGTELMEILGDRQLEVEMIVPSHNLANLEVGERFQVTVDEVGKSYPAKIITLGAKIDPVSQSLKVIAEIDGQFPELLPGMSGIASFDAL
jgi:multidrug efflux pump subunit AcrA (membrane-fusion protein)